ncbi:MAG: glycosyltransferase family 2 protein [Candidatus Delongbacteria bacterium]|jgi:glycosyltransferase involved in cell wall biosynthesis|nr:glycosyltransferase family 2 protein [Candidatus Delongbacteria bacterium]MDY0016713.1 glycosyltransferase family 2 protein [Candidatus Delongbacteria bacterium]
MYKEKKIAVIVPCFDEETQIKKVLVSMPDCVDQIIIVDDKSRDNTVKVVNSVKENYNKIILIEHKKNQGVGGAIASGYKWARDNNFDVAAVMAGDAQMDPHDLFNILDPVVSGEVDYSKGNRLFTGEAFKKIPKIRYFGNSVLSLLTKIASGYWHIADSQSGYTAINNKALHLIDWDKMYKRYGQPNDLLVRLNIYNMKVRDVQINPVYGVGEKSGIKLRKILFSLSWLLLKLFFYRMKEKYVIRDFHPLVLFYSFGAGLAAVSVPLFFRMAYYAVINGDTPKINFLTWMLCVIMSVQFILFAMWFDMEYNKELK